ncbi:UTP--glucose-1-phosphate uridylyltransferase GalU [Paenibacillus senegalensis]|uniref:UTP--glucose-1-phosphate uridylyltransferase GalU n=1 Tax=Paenibacillus senegalensis TaxID=1465766 RepID=UPI0002888D03|nr:UTP--glucose-1-phosphate uridylyltransferase GalU [Paenibacillus senegalensis]
MARVKKAIIPAAGLGTRFLPATKAMPKEMLPIVDKPTIQYIVEEAIQSGIEDIIIVTGKGKRAIEDHFDSAFELEHKLLESRKLDLLEKVQKSSRMADIHYIRQKEPRGLGHAVWCARKFIGDEPFAVLLGDDIVRSEIPCLRQLILQYEQTGSTIIGIKPVLPEEVGRYGIIDPGRQQGDLYKVKALVEKPEPSQAPSTFAIMGRYILNPSIFDCLENADAGAGGEIQLTDAIQQLVASEPVHAYHFEGVRYDVGEKLGYILTSLDFALASSELQAPILKALDERLNLYRAFTG